MSIDPKLMDKVISGLDKDKPITLKQGCAMLGIAYNTTRLRKLITEYKQSIETARIVRAKMARTPITNSDKKQIIESYITGDSITGISDLVFRSTAVVKRVLSEFNVPRDRVRLASDGVDITYTDTNMLQETGQQPDINENRPTIIYTGALLEAKGLGMLQQAIDFRDESEALFQLLVPLGDDEPSADDLLAAGIDVRAATVV